MYILWKMMKVSVTCCIYIKQSGAGGTGVWNGPSLFWKALEKELPSLVLLDIMLPEEDGLSILKKIRIRPDVRKLPVIMLTAKGSEFDTVVGLDSGADDYIPKPFRMMELISRVRALLRRSEDNGAEEYRMENLYVCPGRHEVTVDQEPVNLTLKEYEMLCLLLKNSGTVLSRTQLLNQIWGYEFDGEKQNRRCTYPYPSPEAWPGRRSGGNRFVEWAIRSAKMMHEQLLRVI